MSVLQNNFLKIPSMENLRTLFSSTGLVSVLENNVLKFRGVFFIGETL